MAAASSGQGGSSTAPPQPTATSTAANGDPNVAIRFRLSDLDSILERNPSPYDNRVSPFLPQGETLEAVPVVRIFGATDQGQRVCAHIHGAFSYVYIEYKGSLNPEISEWGVVELSRAMTDLCQQSTATFTSSVAR